MTVFCGGGPTEAIIAAYARMTAIYIWDKETEASLKGQGIASGTWFPAEKGGVYKVDMAHPEGPSLKDAIVHLSTPEGVAALRATQEQNFKVPDDWNTAAKVVPFLEEITR